MGEKRIKHIKIRANIIKCYMKQITKKILNDKKLPKYLI